MCKNSRNMQISDFEIFMELHGLEYKESKNQTVEIVSICMLVDLGTSYCATCQEGNTRTNRNEIGEILKKKM